MNASKVEALQWRFNFPLKLPSPFEIILNLYREIGKVLQIIYLISKEEESISGNGNISMIFPQKGRNRNVWGNILLILLKLVSSISLSLLSLWWLYLHNPSNSVGWLIKIIYAKKKIQSDLPLLPSSATETHSKSNSLQLTSVNSITFVSGYFSWPWWLQIVPCPHLPG